MNTNQSSSSHLMDTAKDTIIKRFCSHVKGKKADTTDANINHDGKEGHWLERQMGISPNSDNTADLFGYEMKKQTRGKTTFGDWSANYYIFQEPDFGSRDEHFLPVFGKANAKKEGRFSWSGEPCPSVSDYNKHGQILTIDTNQNILALYSYRQDMRPKKAKIVPPHLQQNNLVLARWEAESIRAKLERKFDQKGWFKCEKNDAGVYQSIAFGSPIDFAEWIKLVKEGIVYLDSGMYQGNPRHYSQWRANNTFWDSLIIDRCFC